MLNGEIYRRLNGVESRRGTVSCRGLSFPKTYLRSLASKPSSVATDRAREVELVGEKSDIRRGPQHRDEKRTWTNINKGHQVQRAPSQVKGTRRATHAGCRPRPRLRSLTTSARWAVARARHSTRTRSKRSRSMCTNNGSSILQPAPTDRVRLLPTISPPKGSRSSADCQSGRGRRPRAGRSWWPSAPSGCPGNARQGSPELASGIDTGRRRVTGSCPACLASTRTCAVEGTTVCPS